MGREIMRLRMPARYAKLRLHPVETGACGPRRVQAKAFPARCRRFERKTIVCMTLGPGDARPGRSGVAWHERRVPPRHADILIRVLGCWRKIRITAWITTPGFAQLGMPS
jgi:hypothetical protein